VAVLFILIRFPLTEGRAANLSLFSIYTDPFILYGYTASIPFLIVLYKAFRLLGYIRQNKLHSSLSVGALKSIRNFALLFSIMTAAAGVYIKLYHNKNDDPAGFLAINALITLLSVGTGVAAAVYANKVQKAIDIL
jgi:hypothetical protein